MKYVTDCVCFALHIVYHAPRSFADDDKIEKSCNGTSEIWKQNFHNGMFADYSAILLAIPITDGMTGIR